MSSFSLLSSRLGGTEEHRSLKALWKTQIDPERSQGQKVQELNVCTLNPELAAGHLILFFFFCVRITFMIFFFLPKSSYSTVLLGMWQC